MASFKFCAFFTLTTEPFVWAASSGVCLFLEANLAGPVICDLYFKETGSLFDDRTVAVARIFGIAAAVVVGGGGGGAVAFVFFGFNKLYQI